LDFGIYLEFGAWNLLFCNAPPLQYFKTICNPHWQSR
jgi:hypothetical protein